MLPKIDVIGPISQAWEWMVALLFRPFNLKAWLTIGFCSWLAQLGEGGMNCNANLPSGSDRSAARDQVAAEWEKIRLFLNEHLVAVIVVGSILVIGAVALGIVVTWLGSRGKFMLLHCVAGRVAEIERPWREYRAHGNSLFRFRFFIALVMLFVVVLFLAALATGFLLHRSGSGAPVAVLVVAAIVAGLLFLGVCLALGVVNWLTDAFVVPLMYRRGASCLAAWRELLGLLRGQPVPFILVMFLSIGMSLAAGVVVIALACVTCCVAGCLLALPYLGSVLFLPVTVFFRAYPLLVLRQFGPEYDRLTPSEPAPAT